MQTIYSPFLSCNEADALFLCMDEQDIPKASLKAYELLFEILCKTDLYTPDKEYRIVCFPVSCEAERVCVYDAQSKQFRKLAVVAQCQIAWNVVIKFVMDF